MSSPAVAIPHRRRHLRAVPVPPLRVADVALFYGGRSGGIRTYLDEKAAYAAGTGAFEHHLIVPGRRRRSEGRRHELPSVSVAGSNGYRWPLGARALAETLRRGGAGGGGEGCASGGSPPGRRRPPGAPGGALAAWRGGDAAGFPGLDADETCQRI